MKRGLWAIAGVLVLGVAAAGHDTWVVPGKFRAKAGERVEARLATSEAFPTSEAAARLARVERFVARSEGGEETVTGYRAKGEFLVGDVTAGKGVTMVLIELKPLAFELEAKVFHSYLTEERLAAVLAAREAAGKSNAPGRERYRKIAKAAVCEEGAKGNPAVYGTKFAAWLEIVPEVDPCSLKVGDEMRVQVLFQGKPIEGVWVVAGYEGVKGHGYPVWEKTDAAGLAKVKVDRAGAWFVRTLHMVAADGKETDWDSAFSTLTFFVVP